MNEMDGDSLRNRFDGRLFGIALLTGFVGALAQLPIYAPDSATLTFGLMCVLVLIGAALGARFGGPVGLGMPLVTDWLAGEPVRARAGRLVTRMAGIGIVVGLAMAAYQWYVLGPVQRELGVDVVSNLLDLPLAVQYTGMALYGGFTEEIFWRFGLMAALVRASARIASTADGRPSSVAVAVSILISALGFGAIHLLPLATVGALAAVPVGLTLLQAGGFGVLLGWLYWRYGLEAAIVVHLVNNLVLVSVWQVVS